MNSYKNYYQNKSVLVTGGAGAIGGALARELALQGAEVIILDDLSSSSLWNIPMGRGITFIKGSILDEAVLKRVFHNRPQIVFHLAAFFANQNSIDHPEQDLMVNGLGSLRVLQYCALCRVDRVVFASSSSVYGANALIPFREEGISMHLTTPYQVTKMLGELYCNFFHIHYELATVNLRFFNSYGPGELPGQYRNVIPNFIYRALRGLPLTITGTGEETRDFTYIEDIVDGLLRSGYYEQAVNENINLASGKETTILELANRINALTGNPTNLDFSTRRKWDTKSRRLAATDKAEHLLEYKAKVLLDDGLRKTIDWFRENWQHINNESYD